MARREVNTLIIGSGAAGLAAALHLARGGAHPVIYTEGLQKGTSINTGSDKQTYYKLGLCGDTQDSVTAMARDLAAGGSMHGDLALCEAANSVRSFMNLVELGVPFPCNEFGEYAGYKTDHDPRCRATSCGPYTSREMCRVLIGAIQKIGVEVQEERVAVELLVEKERCFGAVFVNLTPGAKEVLEVVEAKHTVLACGGPGGLYECSVYPEVQTGAIGLALAAGVKARNLAESQFGLASTKFRWNVSGSYMQVLPRFVSVDKRGTEREFLRDAFPSVEAMYDAIFLKGYQWPFAASHLPGSSLIDLLVHEERVTKKRRVYLDFRSDPADFDRSKCAAETREYLTRSGALEPTPLRRLLKLNPAAIQLYQEHGINLASERLEVAVCAQHNNGGLAGDCHWESENMAELYPIGEVNGSHGITRPGGTALNAGQCGALRAAEMILHRRTASTAFTGEPRLFARLSQKSELPDWKTVRLRLQRRMSESGAFLRSRAAVEKALAETEKEWHLHQRLGFAGADAGTLAETLRNEQLLAAQSAYLSAILFHVDSGAGSRGGAVVLAPDGETIHPDLPYRMVKEDLSRRRETLETRLVDGKFVSAWAPLRPLPQPEEWFENVWRNFKERNEL